MIRINDIISRVAENYDPEDLAVIQQAYIFSARVHDGQVRLSGEPYLSHPLEVAGILAEMNLDPVCVAAGLLHDVVEDTHTTDEEIKNLFGKKITRIVSGVTKLSKLQAISAQHRQAESIRKMLLAMADDIRVILIKLADRLHNMRTLQFHRKEEKKKTISQETLDIYAPLASRLGIYWIKRELEDTAFKYTEPEACDQLRRDIAQHRVRKENFLENIETIFRNRMKKEGISCEVYGRYKHLYSIHYKMKSQNLPFDEIYDIIAFRIIVDTPSDCYQALGNIHGGYPPIANKIKDYIARPKSNMYQSLHTTVEGPYNEIVEIQIRTHDMERIANSGVAAHWGYKEGKVLDENMSQKFAWIQSLVENHIGIQDPDEFMESVRIDLFPDEVYVFTPDGEIKVLSKGATPVDFAYSIHTEVGHRCVRAKVNGRMVPLRYELQTGDRVDIVTQASHHPSKDWLGFVKTAKARGRIRQWIRIQEKERSISLGREMCEKAFRKYRLNYNDCVKTEKMDQVISDFGFKTLEDLIANVGYGKITPLQIIRKIEPKPEEAENDEKETFLDKVTEKLHRKKDVSGISIKGIDDILVRFGKCCQPVPGDPIIGFITRGRGVTVHRTNCVNALKLTPERRIEVEWADQTSETFPVNILVESMDRVGLLADLTAKISKAGANIVSVHSSTNENDVVETLLRLNVKNTRHLNQIMTGIRKVKLILNVSRLDT